MSDIATETQPTDVMPEVQPPGTVDPPIEPGSETEDIETIFPFPKRLEINGVDCAVRRLKTREFLSLVNVMTTGLSGSLSEITIDLTDPEAVATDISALMMLAIPRAVDEFSVFLRQIVDPIDPAKAAVVGAYLMDNPDVDVMLDVFEIVATQEQDDLVTLVGKAQAMWSRVAPLYARRKTT